MFPAAIDERPDLFVQQFGQVFARFGANTQDSGNVSYGVEVAGQRFFLKTAGDPADPEPFAKFERREAGLRNAARLAEAVSHPLLPEYHGLIESPAGPLLVYEWRDGEHLGTRQDDPASAFQRFRALSVEQIATALDQLFDLHDLLNTQGWVEGDFYDGSLLYDFGTRQLTAMDLDDYQLGAYRNDMGRMFGSSRFMAPEELSLGAPIDDRTTAFVMARTALVFLADGTLDRPAFKGSDALYAVLQEAVTTRFPSYPAFHAAWRAASSTT
ncbi:serine/threonine protein kinase [Streptomyces sp. SID13031]|uniref:serine/threonine protein kinase n=1 Tax=Streptomyces sp. SID13031 TaxID=2706046 RepID=UPI0013CD92AF|nr:serine/threonine protein kinase [Streptomyces sp. SID13031]NEA33023.1 serine/threonine protein kinase [Streptomyces sp. SID13031]